MKTKNVILVVAFALTACGLVLLVAAMQQRPQMAKHPTLMPTQATMLPTRDSTRFPIATMTQDPNEEILETEIAKILPLVLTPYSTPSPHPTQPPYLTPTSYPTASEVKANAVAFISRDKNNSLDTALWVANVDGSGERKLVDIPYNRQDGDWGITSKYLQWSPDGKWINYIDAHALWMISPDGSIKRKLLHLPDAGLFLYSWSPDSSKIAYLEYSHHKPTVTPTPGPDMGLDPYLVGMIDIETGKVSELSSFEANAGIPILSWSPNGRDLLFIENRSFSIYEVSTRKVVKTIKRGCGLERNFSWSPNGKWFSYTDNGVGRYFSQWICVGGLDDSNHRIDAGGTSSTPVWDKTGNFLYFVTRKTNPDSDPNLKIDERLMRYDVRTQNTERLLALRDQQTFSYIQSVSISPDKRTLLLESQFSETKFDLIFVDVQPLTTTKFTLDFEDLKVPFLYSYILETAWSPDNQNLILFAGDFCTPSGCGGWGPRGNGSFYTLNTKTGKVSVFSGAHSIHSWQVSPIATTP
jgi:Tol biopolymer transport system component